MNKISIDWMKAEEKPNTAQKVEGRYLIDLRAKINELERRLTEKNQDLNTSKEELEEANRDIKRCMEKSSSTELDLNEMKEGKSKLETEKKELEIILKETEIKLNSSTKEVIDLKTRIDNNNTEYKGITSEKDKEIENLKAELDEIMKKTSDKDKEIEEIKKNIIFKMDQEIESLKADLNEKIQKIEALSNESKSQNAKIVSSNKKTLEPGVERSIVEKIRAIMKFKGFLSDREFYEVSGEKEEKKEDTH